MKFFTQDNQAQLTRRQLLKAGGMLMVGSVAGGHLLMAQTAPEAAALKGPFPIPAANLVDSFIAIGADGSITAYNGHVDLGTGIRTALGQLVADELYVDFSAVTMVLGHTARTPDLGPTIASNTIQVSSLPMRHAAAQVRQLLIKLASEKSGVPAERITTQKGVVIAGDKRFGYGELVQGQDLQIEVDAKIELRKSGFEYVGKSVQRVDIPNKVLGALTYIHDLRVPGMLHGRVIRPPYTGADATAPLGSSLVSVDEKSIAHLPGIVKVVVKGDFVGVVAEREEQAIAAMRQLKVTWKEWAGLPDLSLNGLHQTLVDHEKTDRVLQEDEGALQAVEQAKIQLTRDYVWPYHAHGSIGPSCAIAQVGDGQIQVWTGSQNPHDVCKDISKLMDVNADNVNVTRLEASGCYGRNCADDVCSDAVLMSAAVGGKPVRVQLMREQESGWEPKGTGQLIRVRGGMDEQHNVAAYELRTCYPSNNASALALILTGKVSAKIDAQQMGDRTAIPQYEYPKIRMISQDAVPIVRASWMRGVSALPNVFAHESWIDECAYLAKADPIEYRLRYLKDPRAVALIAEAKKQCNWQDGPAHRNPAAADERLVKGRGFAYARYIHSKFPGYGAAWATWVVDVTVDRETGEIKIDKVFVAQDTGAMVNPAGVRHQVHGNVVQSTSRVLKEFVTFDKSGVTSLEWGGYPILRFDELPEIDSLLVERPNEAPMGAGESASVPSAGAIANAFFDATGVRLFEVPFTPSRVLAALKAAKADASPASSK